MVSTRRRVAHTLAASGVLLIAAAAVPAYAAGEDYVALGDSYAAGVGAGNYLTDGTSCQRSLGGYPGLLAGTHGYALNLQACSGADTGDLLGQMTTLSPATRRVSISVGGNDIGFAPVISECMKPSWWGNCTSAVDGARARIANVLPARLRTVYSAVRAKAPNAQVIVTGYPRLFNGRDCSVTTFFSLSEMTRLNAAADALNATLRREAEAAGFQFIDPTQSFLGHAVCGNPEWIHNASMTASESFHPKAAGHRAYASLVGGGLDPAPANGPTIRTGAQTSSDVTRGQIVEPDVESPEALAAAARAGVSRAEVHDLALARDRVRHGRGNQPPPDKDAVQRARG